METTCPGCGAKFNKCDGPTHKYFGESPECWKAYGQVLAREYENRNYWQVHRLTVDTYAVQHPLNTDKRNIQSVNIHLMALYAILELQQPFETIPPLLDAAANNFKDDFLYLTPPTKLGEITVLDVLGANSAPEHCTAVWDWSRSVWAAWSPQRRAIEELFVRTKPLIGSRHVRTTAALKSRQ